MIRTWQLRSMGKRIKVGNDDVNLHDRCYWHACPDCFPEDESIVGGGETAGYVRARDEKRIREIAKEFEVEVIWECHLSKMLENNAAMRAFFDNTPDSGPIDLHDAFFGGNY